MGDSVGGMRQNTDGPDKDAWKKKRDAQKAFYKDPSVSVGGDNQTKIQKAPDWLRSLTACSIWIGSWYGAFQYCAGGNHEPGEGPSVEATIGVGILLVFILPGLAFWWYNEYK